jgi:hypothetical protein
MEIITHYLGVGSICFGDAENVKKAFYRADNLMFNKSFSEYYLYHTTFDVSE